MGLKALEVKNLKHSGGKNRVEPYSDGEGLDLMVSPLNRKTWRLRYSFNGKRPEIKLGKYPEISLESARCKAAVIRTQAANGVDPKHARLEDEERKARRFELVALEWWEVQKPTWKKEHARRVKYWLTEHAFPTIGKLPMADIDSAHIAEIMIKMSNTECSPLLSIINRIFGRALAQRLTKTNPAQGFPLRDVIPPLAKTKHRAAITDIKLLGQLMRDITTSTTGASTLTKYALRILPYIFVRPKELYELKWSCIDFDAKLIRIDAEDMKKNRAHIVPMSPQVITLFNELKPITAYSPYVFPNKRSSQRSMSKNVMTDELRRIGYGADVCCSHGFRTTASTLLHEIGMKHDVIEMSLAHLTGNATSRSYNDALYLDEREKLMLFWANYLDGLRDGADVIPIKRKA